MFSAWTAYATQQINDKIIYEDKTCELKIDWSYPSPLEVYYEKNKDLKYPFGADSTEVISTANYRGHISTWKIADKKLYLAKIAQGINDSKAKNFPLSKIFTSKIIKNNMVPADWFTGYLLILSRPFKDWYESPYSANKFFIINYAKFVIVSVEKGNILSETSFGPDDFWNITRDYWNYNRFKESDRTIIEKYYNYINGFRDDSFREPEKKAIYTERDFNLFLKRYYTKEIPIPLTDYCIIKDAMVDYTEKCAFIESDLLIKEGISLLFFEMGASNVLPGPWEQYSSGAVQVLIKLDQLAPAEHVIDKNVRFINNYAKYGSSKSVSGEIDIIKVENNYVIISGNIYLKSEAPATFQKINLDNNKIPIYSIREYLERNANKGGELFSYNVEEKYLEIKSKTIDYLKKQGELKLQHNQ